jgi:NADH-quinone oxidoreductase subunit A
MDDYSRQYGLILLLALVAVTIPATLLFTSWLFSKIRVRPRKPNPIKYDTYESGMETIGGRWERFNVRYYKYALLFVVFDVEVVFLFPWATRVNALGWGGFGAVAVFLFILTVGFAYEWRRGGLEWEESGQQPHEPTHSSKTTSKETGETTQTA